MKMSVVAERFTVPSTDAELPPESLLRKLVGLTSQWHAPVVVQVLTKKCKVFGPKTSEAQISAVRLFSTLELRGGSPEKNSDSSVSQLSALATLRPIWGRVGQGAFELSLPQIRKFFFFEKPLRVWIYLLRKYAYKRLFFI